MQTVQHQQTLAQLIDAANRSDEPTVLHACWTSNPDFCNEDMKDCGMLNDMEECDALVAALHTASTLQIKIPKLRAHIVKRTETSEFSMDEIYVDIESYVPIEFSKLYWDIMDGKLPIANSRTTDGFCTWIRRNTKNWCLESEEIVRIINRT